MKRHQMRQRYRMVELQRWRDKCGLKFTCRRRMGHSARRSPCSTGEVFGGLDRLDLLEDALKSGRAPHSSGVQGRLERAAAIEEMMPS